MKNKVLLETLTIGKGKVKHIGRWSWGMELSLWSPERAGICPKMELYCFKFVGLPPRGEMFRKGIDIRGLWKIVWWQPSITMMQWKVFEKKGWRTRHIHVPIKIHGFFRTW